MAAPKFTTSQVEAHNAWVAGGCKGPPPGAGLAAAPVSNVVAPVKVESPLEALFLALWKKCGGPELIREAQVIPARKFRVDFLHPETRTIFELQGYADHSSRKGFARDNAKFLLLAFWEYQVITLDSKSITQDNVLKLINLLTKKGVR